MNSSVIEVNPDFNQTYSGFLSTRNTDRLAAVIAPNDDLPRGPFERSNVTILYGFLNNLTSVDVKADAMVEKFEAVKQITIRI